MAATSTTPSGFHPEKLGGALKRAADGIWYSSEREAVSYLEAGNATCFEIEEGSFWFQHRAACLTALVKGFPPAGAIYDIGGGNGFLARSLIDAGFETVVVEPGETGARNARRRGIPTVLCATLSSANFAGDVLPAAGLFDVLEHVENEAEFLEEIHRCLAPGGRLYLTVPAHSWLWSDDDVVAGHFRRYTLKSVTARLRAAGLERVFGTYLFSVLPLPLFALRAFPSFFGRRTLSRKKYAALHQPRSRWLVDRVWQAERRALANGRTIPFGSSCLIVAEKASCL
jgi:SAM-dependent methyltransferase